MAESYYAKLENGTTLHVHDQVSDVQVIINSVVLGYSERWFSVLTSKNESFVTCAKRVVKQLSKEKRSTVSIEFITP